MIIPLGEEVYCTVTLNRVQIVHTKDSFTVVTMSKNNLVSDTHGDYDSLREAIDVAYQVGAPGHITPNGFVFKRSKT